MVLWDDREKSRTLVQMTRVRNDICPQDAGLQPEAERVAENSSTCKF